MTAYFILYVTHILCMDLFHFFYKTKTRIRDTMIKESDVLIVLRFKA